jgi:hypothetical protein
MSSRFFRKPEAIFNKRFCQTIVRTNEPTPCLSSSDSDIAAVKDSRHNPLSSEKKNLHKFAEFLQT